MAAGDGSRGDGSVASAGVCWLEACACVSPSPRPLGLLLSLPRAAPHLQPLLS